VSDIQEGTQLTIFPTIGETPMAEILDTDPGDDNDDSVNDPDDLERPSEDDVEDVDPHDDDDDD